MYVSGGTHPTTKGVTGYYIGGRGFQAFISPVSRKITFCLMTVR